MRPPEFTGGNLKKEGVIGAEDIRFNEAAGIHRRKRPRPGKPPRFPLCFNEAAGIHRRKPTRQGENYERDYKASMRPPEFTGGNGCQRGSRPPKRSTCFDEAAGIHRRKPTSTR